METKDKHIGAFMFGTNNNGIVINYGDVDLTPQLSFDVLCEQAREAVKAKTQAQWKLGDLANQVLEGRLGTLTQFATNTGLAKRTVETYAQLAGFYADTQRLFEFCNYTHYKYACQFSKGDVNQALDYLEKAEGELMPCDEFYRYLCELAEKPTPPKTKAELVAENGELRELLFSAKEWMLWMAVDPDDILFARIKAVLDA